MLNGGIMNFIFINADTFRRDHLGCYGNKWISTPNIDKFATNSLVFDSAYSGSFPTVPNRRDVMTGRFTSSYTPWAPLTAKEVVLQSVLTRNGYMTMMIADTPHILENGYFFDRGFEGFEWIRGQESDRWKTYPEFNPHSCDPKKLRGREWLGKRHRRNVAHWRKESDRFAARTMSTACDWLEENYKRQNFFLYVDTFDPHEPWDAPQYYIDMYNPGYKGQVVDYPLYWYTKDFLSKEELKHCRALYAAECTMVDRWVGRVLQKIEDLGLYKDTFVVFTTDHGFLHGEHGIIGKSLIDPDITPRQLTYTPLYEEINHIPFIAHNPFGVKGRTKAMIQPMDIMPTFLELANIKIPPTVEGKSFTNVIAGKTNKHRDYAISAPYLKAPSACATFVEGNFRGVLYMKTLSKTALIDRAVDGYEKAQAVKELRKDELYNIKDDPEQKVDIAKKYPKVLKEMNRKFVDFIRSVKTAEDIVELWKE